MQPNNQPHLTHKLMTFADLQRLRSEGKTMSNTTASPPTAPSSHYRPSPPSARPPVAQPRPTPSASERRKRRRYTPSEKATILSECDTRNVKVVAREYGVSSSIVYRWRDLLRHKRRKSRLVEVLEARQAGEKAPARAQSQSGLDALHTTLEALAKDCQTALAQVDRMRSAFRAAFGGGEP